MRIESIVSSLNDPLSRFATDAERAFMRELNAGCQTPVGVRSSIDDIASFSQPILILTGGEPMYRQDIYELAAYATDKNLHVVMSPCGGLINKHTAQKIREAGIQRISISLDGATASIHDEFRGVKVAFDDAIQGIRLLKDADVEFQINTTVSKHNVHDLPQILELAKELGAVVFNPFFLVPTGRGKEIAHYELSSEEYEHTLTWVF